MVDWSKSKFARKDRLRAEIGDLRHIGEQLANVAFNLAQDDTLSADRRKMFKQLHQQWDRIPRSEKSR